MNIVTLEVFLHYCYKPTQFMPRSRAVDDAERWLVSQQLVQTSSSCAVVYDPTERGEAWKQMLQTTPLPVANWTDPRTNKVVGGDQ